MKKQIVLLAMMLLPMVAGARPVLIDSIYYNLIANAKQAEVTNQSGGDSRSGSYKGSVNIPPKVTYGGVEYDVKNIGQSAFYNCSGLTSVSIPESVTSIGSSAFANCSSLTSFTIPNGVTSIGHYTFAQCSSLTSVTIPTSVRSIGNSAFQYCSSLKSLTIPNSVTSIESYAFEYCRSLKSLTIPNSVTMIGGDAFHGCNLSSVTFHISSISDWFRGMTSLKEVIFGDEVTSIGDWAFHNCSSLTSVTIPNSVTRIGANAFRNCTGLTSLTISNSITSIGQLAFDGCRLSSVNVYVTDYSSFCNNKIVGVLKSINIPVRLIDAGGTEIKDYVVPEGVSSIGNDAFYNCRGLITVTIPNSVKSIGQHAFESCSALTSIMISSSVTSIGSYAFNGCSALTSVNVSVRDYSSFCKNMVVGQIKNSIGRPICLIDVDGAEIKEYIVPEGVSSIGNNAFYNCKGLTSITFPNTVSSIGNDSFSYCTGLNTVTIPNSVTSIGSSTFSGCKSLKSVIIGSGVLSIGDKAFYNAPLIKAIWLTNTPPSGYTNVKGTVNYASNNQYASLSNVYVYPFLSSMFEVDGVKYVPIIPSERTCDVIDCAYNETNEIINIDEMVSYKGVSLTVKQIKPYSFYDNQHIKDVNLSYKGNAGMYSFGGCTKMSSATINIKGTIGNNAFYSCSALHTAVLGQDVISIGKEAFYNCSQLMGIEIPDSVVTIGSSAFYGCSAMMSLKFGSSVATINSAAFSNCSSLQNILIPQGVTSIGDNVFSGCKSLSIVVLANSEKELKLGSNGNNPLFSDCPLNAIYIGRNISYPTASDKGYSPFYRNTTLRTVIITDKEKEISTNEFYGCTNLKKVRIGDGVTTIGDWAFSGCSNLEYFAFGTSLETIGKEAFSDCSAVTRLISKSTTPPVCGTQALDDINKWNCTLYVPDGYASAYQHAEQWKEFFFIEEGDCDEFIPLEPGDVNGDGFIDVADIACVIDVMAGNYAVVRGSADVNEDNIVDVADIASIIDKMCKHRNT